MPRPSAGIHADRAHDRGRDSDSPVQQLRCQDSGAEGLQLAGAVKTAIAEYHQTNSSWPATNEAAGANADYVGKYVASVETSASGTDPSVITITMGAAAPVSTDIQGKTITITAAAGTGSVTWTCDGGTISDSYLPAACK